MFVLSKGKVGSVKLDENRLKKPKVTCGGIWYDEVQTDTKIGVQRGWSAEGIQRYDELLKKVAQDRRDHREFFPRWLQGLQQAAMAKEATVKKKRVELGSNEAGANWSLDDDEEVALTNELNTKKVEIINQRVVAEKAAKVNESSGDSDDDLDNSGSLSDEDENEVEEGDEKEGQEEDEKEGQEEDEEEDEDEDGKDKEQDDKQEQVRGKDEEAVEDDDDDEEEQEEDEDVKDENGEEDENGE